MDWHKCHISQIICVCAFIWAGDCFPVYVVRFGKKKYTTCFLVAEQTEPEKKSGRSVWRFEEGSGPLKPGASHTHTALAAAAASTHTAHAGRAGGARRIAGGGSQ